MPFAGRCVALFFVLVISFDAVSSDELLELSCMVAHDCKQFERSDVNVTCHNGQCECSSAAKDSMKCSPTETMQSNIIGGPCPCRMPEAECNESQKICYCAKNFVASDDKRRCLRETVALEEDCELDTQCHGADHHATCDEKTKKCTCRADFIAHKGTCVSVADPSAICETDNDCQRYGAHVTCMEETEKCTCLTGYIKALNKTECLRIASYRQNCSEDQQCQTQLGPGGACIEGMCDCSDLHYSLEKRAETEDKKNVTQTICARIIEIGEYCRDDKDCYHQQLPDEEQTMSCIFGECNCKWGYYSINNQECVKGNNGNNSKPTLICVILSMLAIIEALAI